ncbi:MAG: hypothetical protein ACJAQT_004037 [Akkermansiaceae bacterium]|jgi:hypothetical protein
MTSKTTPSPSLSPSHPPRSPKKKTESPTPPKVKKLLGNSEPAAADPAEKAMAPQRPPYSTSGNIPSSPPTSAKHITRTETKQPTHTAASPTDSMAPPCSRSPLALNLKKSGTSLPTSRASKNLNNLLSLPQRNWKPFTRDEVLARIHAILRRAKPSRSKGTFSVQDLHVHPEGLTALRDETRIELSPREIKILQLLHTHRGMPVSRDTLLDFCWGQDYFLDPRTLDQQISVLRKKIERDLSAPAYIETVREIGYRRP